MPIWVEHRVFAPLGLRNTGYAVTGKVIPERAEEYRIREGKLEHADCTEFTGWHSRGGVLGCMMVWLH